MYHNSNPSVCRKWSDGNVFWWHDRECLLQETFKHFFCLFLVAGNPEEPLTCRLCAAPAASPHTGMHSVVRRATLGYPQPRACLQSVPSHLPSLCVQLRLSPIGCLITGANADFGCCFSVVRGSGKSPTQLLQLCQMNAAHSHSSASQWAQISLLRCSVLFLPKKNYLLLPSASSDLLFIGRKALFFSSNTWAEQILFSYAFKKKNKNSRKPTLSLLADCFLKTP